MDQHQPESQSALQELRAGSCDSIARSTEGLNTNAERLSNAVGRFVV